jgi:hypothetical protein
MTRFSVCLPVRNGWPYVRECVESVLRQTYPHFELLVLDNQSGDETLSWLTSLDDPRIQISRSLQPLSIVDSWARIRTAEKQEFMTMIGHDDILDPGFLAAIKALIDKHPKAGLYLTGGRLINPEGRTIRSCRPVSEQETAADYLKARFTFQRDVFGTGYVMRSADYDRAGGIPGFEKLFFADDALWLNLMCGRYKVADPTEYFAVRIHPGSESASLPSAWRSILTGLNQFNDFLHSYVAADAQAGDIVDGLGPGFMLAYHRNAAIFALIEASQAGGSIAPEVVEKLEGSLARCAPSAAGRLWRAPKVGVLRALNASPARELIPVLWTLYNQLKNRAR